MDYVAHPKSDNPRAWYAVRRCTRVNAVIGGIAPVLRITWALGALFTIATIVQGGRLVTSAAFFFAILAAECLIIELVAIAIRMIPCLKEIEPLIESGDIIAVDKVIFEQWQLEGTGSEARLYELQLHKNQRQ